MTDMQRARELEAVAERNLRSYVIRHVNAGPDRASALLCIDTLTALRAAPTVDIEMLRALSDRWANDRGYTGSPVDDIRALIEQQKVIEGKPASHGAEVSGE